MTTIRHFTVTGMTCGHCEDAVTQEVGALEGVTEAAVSASSGSLTVKLADQAPAADEAIIAAVDEAGYQASAQQ